jgi:hypothetical protein
MTFRAQAFAIAGMIGLSIGLIRGQTMLSLLSLSSLVWIFSDWLIFYLQLRFQLPNLGLVRWVNNEKDANRSLWAERTIDVQIRWRSNLRLYGATLNVLDLLPENLEVLGGQANTARREPSRSWLVGSILQFLGNAEKELPQQCVLGGGRSPKEWGYQGRIRSAGRLVFPGFRITFESTHGLFKHERFIQCEQSFRALPSFVDASDYRSLTKKSNVIPRHGIHRLLRSGMGSELLELREYMAGDPFKSIAWKVSAKRDQWMTRQYESEVPARVQLIVDGSSASRVGGFGSRLLDQMTFVAASAARMAIHAGDPVGLVMCDERGIRRFAPMSGEKGFQGLLRAVADFSVNPPPPPCALNQRMIDAVWGLLSQRYPELLDFKVNQIPFRFFLILPSSRTRSRLRFQIAGALSEIFGLSAVEQIALVHNDPLFASRIQDLLNSAGLPWIAPVVASSESRDRDPILRMNRLAECISTAVGHARDNEVIVVLSDLLNCIGVLEFLLPAVKMAVAKHHRVSFVCPTSTFQRPSRRQATHFSTNWSANDLLLVAEQSRLQIQAEQLQRELRRCGATLSLSGDKSAIRFIMSEMDVVKAGRSRSQGALK